MGGGHHHHGHPHETARLGWVAVLNVAITLAQLAGGLLAGSLALLSDALHNGSDVLGLVVAWLAARVRARPPSAQYTFGLKRVEILAALFNAATLIGVALYLVVEAFERLAAPPAVDSGLVIALAALGLAVNALSVWLLHRDRDHDMNLRAAWLHLIGDALTSAAVLAGGIAMALGGGYWIDPLLTVLISLYLLAQSWRIVREGVEVVLMGAPSGLSLDEIEAAVLELPAVEEIHHMHLWRLDSRQVHFEAHLRVADMPLRDADQARQATDLLLRERFGIAHTTLQIECGPCGIAAPHHE